MPAHSSHRSWVRCRPSARRCRTNAMTSAPSSARSVRNLVTTSSPTTTSSGNGSESSSVSTPGTPRSSRNTTSSGASSSITGRPAAATTVARLATRHRPSIRLPVG